MCPRAVVRRRAHERRAAELAATSYAAEEVDPDIAPAVHEELTGLPERYRQPIVLCYLEGLACGEAARRLKLPVGTVKSRLARGRDRLRSRLMRRGFVPSAVLLESILAGDATTATIPAAVVQSTIRMATHLACGNPNSGAVCGCRALERRSIESDELGSPASHRTGRPGRGRRHGVRGRCRSTCVPESASASSGTSSRCRRSRGSCPGG